MAIACHPSIAMIASVGLEKVRSFLFAWKVAYLDLGPHDQDLAG